MKLKLLKNIWNLFLDKITEDDKISTKEFLKLSNSVQKRIIYNIFIQNNLDYDREKILRILDFVVENSLSKSGRTCSLTTNLWIFTSSKYIELVSQSEEVLPAFHIEKEESMKIMAGFLRLKISMMKF